MEHQHHYSGLTESQVTESRNAYGSNILSEPPKSPIYKELLLKFTDPLIIILLIAMVLSMAVAAYEVYEGKATSTSYLEPIGIFISIITAVSVGFGFELSAKRKFDILNQTNDEQSVKVLRDNHASVVQRGDIVVGDIIVLDSGDEIPADGQLLEAISMHVNESTLTGEPITVKSTNSSDFLKDATYPTDFVLRGTTIVEGHGLMKATKVGDQTEYGKVYKGVQIENKIQTPLNKQLLKLSQYITYCSYIIAAVIILGRLALFLYHNSTFELVELMQYMLNTAMIAVTVIVVAVPEGLPMSVTLSLALSMRKMLMANNLVRKMHACETMGAATVICTDKTGTLTQNRMTVTDTCFYNLESEKQILSKDFGSTIISESIAINSTAYIDNSQSKIQAVGNPTEAALLFWLNTHNVDYNKIRESSPIIEQSTFTTEKKYMATVAHSATLDKDILYVKGAPEIVMAKCEYINDGDKRKPIANYKTDIDQQLLSYQNRAMRTLGFAYALVDKDEKCFDEKGFLIKTELIFIGIAAISDPIRSEVPEAIASSLKAGIQIKIVTGDTPATAKEIGRQIGLWTSLDTDRNQITGNEFASMSDEELLTRIADLKIMSRARPMDKARLVQLLQRNGEVVAVTGDGTNDAPALNAAQVGLSMGDGTSVAKEASAITILDNSFKSIYSAVLWGRSLYRNIQRFILFQMTINVAACLIVLIGAFVGTQIPLTVTQMLWVNLIMDTFAAMALASLPPNPKVMSEKPRKTTDNIISKGMTSRIVGVGLTFVAVLLLLLYYFNYHEVTALSSLLYSHHTQTATLSEYELSLFFTIFVMLQFWNMFNAKAFETDESAIARLPKSKGFISIALVILLGQIIIINFGGKMFNVTPISLVDWLTIIASTSLVFGIGEAVRFVKKQIELKRETI